MLFAKHFGFQHVGEGFYVQKLISKAGVETLAVGVLPRALWRDEQDLKTSIFNPLSHRFRDELRTIIRSDRLRDAALFNKNVALHVTVVGNPTREIKK